MRHPWTLAQGTFDIRPSLHSRPLRRTTTMLAFLAAACGGDSSVDPVEVRNLTLTVEPTRLFLGEGQDGRLHAELQDASGRRVPMNDLTWSSSNPEIATVDENGVVVGVDTGSVLVTATANGKKKDSDVRVRGRGRLGIFLASGSGQVGTAGEVLPQPLVVEVRDGTGAGVPGVDVDWKANGQNGSTSAASTTTNQNGLTQVLWTLGSATGEQSLQAQVNGAGTVDFTASAEAGSAVSVALSPKTASLSVGKKQQFTATATDRHGNPVEDASVIWASTAGDVVYVDTAGVATAMSAGKAFIEAYAGPASDLASIDVAPDTTTLVASVAASPSEHTFAALGQTVQLEATAYDGSGQPFSGMTLQWTSTDVSIATVDDMGLVLAKAVGTAYMIVSAACCQEAADTISITVAQVPATVEVSPAVLSLEVGQNRQLAATVTDAGGSPIPTDVVWSTTDNHIALVDDQGLLTARGEGVVTVQAAAAGLVGTSTATVAEPSTGTGEPASILVSPSSFSLNPGQGRQLTARVLDANGSEVTGVAIDWTSSTPNVASISPSGYVTATSEGTAQFTAMTPGGLAATSTATVQASVEGADLFSDDFETGDRSSRSNGVAWTNSGGNVNIRHRSEMRDGAEPRSGDYSMEFYFRGPLFQINAEQRFTLGAGQSDLWAEYWVRYPTNYSHQDDPESAADNNKLFRLWGGDYSGSGRTKVGVEMFRLSNGNSYGRFMSTRNGEILLYYMKQMPEFLDGNIVPMVTDSSPGTFRRGEWVRFRFHYKLDPGSNGAIEAWVDDVKVVDHTNVSILWADGGVNVFQSGYLFGAANAGYAEDTYIYVDDVKFYIQDPGW